MTLTVETWCEALESGKILQWRGALRSPEPDLACFCCLGVAEDLSGLGKWRGDAYWVGMMGESFILHCEVRDMLGLRDSEGFFEFDSLPSDLKREVRDNIGDADDVEECSLAKLNDFGVPFPLIAKVIRARPKGLFREDV